MATFLKSWLFSQKTNNDDDEITSDDNESHVDLDDYIFGKPLYTEMIFENIIHEKYRVAASKLVNNVEQWEYNRMIDSDHVKSLVKSLKLQKYPHFFGSIKVAFTTSDTIKMLDGGHRCAAICEMIRENNEFDMFLDVDVYKFTETLEDGDADLELLDIFVKANSNKQIHVSDLPENKVIEIINMMIAKWPKNIKTDETKGAYRPNITKKSLFQHLKVITQDYTLKQKTSKEIFQNICLMNEKLGNMSLYKLFGRHKVSQQKLSAYEKAKKNDFYLNLDCLYSIDVWVLLINKAIVI